MKLVEAQKMPQRVVQFDLRRVTRIPRVSSPTFDRTNWTLGVSMSVPILTGGRQKGDEAVAQAELEQSRLQRRQVEEMAALDTRSAWAELVAARAAWDATAGTIQQAQRAYEIANVRFTNGVSTQLELSDARLLPSAGRGQPHAGRARSAGGARARRAAAEPAGSGPSGGSGCSSRRRRPGRAASAGAIGSRRAGARSGTRQCRAHRDR